MFDPLFFVLFLILLKPGWHFWQLLRTERKLEGTLQHDRVVSLLDSNSYFEAHCRGCIVRIPFLQCIILHLFTLNLIFHFLTAAWCCESLTAKPFKVAFTFGWPE